MTQNLVDLFGNDLSRPNRPVSKKGSKPLLRWAGSKLRLVPKLRGQLPADYQRYIEPFAGSASLFFEVRPRKALLSDVNEDLINFYKHIKKAPDLMHDQLLSMSVDEVEYLKVRRQLVTEEDPYHRALYFWYLNRTCFNGLYRTNKSGVFNVPFGTKLPQMPSRQQVQECVKLLRRASLVCCGYQASINAAGEGDFMYVDPPYRRGSSRNRGEYGPGAMADSDMGQLVVLLRNASSRGAKILLSYNDCLANELPGWQHESVRGKYLISANPSQRAVINEFTSRNY